jgi:arylsulfatase A-like enzyme
MSAFTPLIRTTVAAFIALVVASCAADHGTAPQGVVAGSASVKRPNILFILADDLGYADIGAFGSEIPTPNLDSLAKNGMVLTDFYSAMSCAPARAMFMSGTDNHLAGLASQGGGARRGGGSPAAGNEGSGNGPRGNANSNSNATGEAPAPRPGAEGYLNLRVASLAELMTDAGYNTYMAGKWHLGATPERGPHARGFKRVFASLDGAAHLGSWDWRGPQDARFFDQDEIVTVGKDWYSTRDYTKKMIGYIEQDRAEGKPFFAWLAYTAPHWPLQAPKQTIAKFKGKYDEGYEALYAKRFARQKQLGLLPKDAKPIDNARYNPRWSDLAPEQKKLEARHMEIYAAMVSDLDTYVGEVIAYLKKIGEFDNTFIMFMSDNGAESSRLDLRPPYIDHVGKEYDHSFENLGAGNTYIMYGANWASASATPFNRHKASGWEGGYHVPAFVHYPRKVARGSRSSATGTIMDMLPTFLALAGTEHPGTKFRGRDVLQPRGRNQLPMFYGAVAQVHADDEVLGWESGGPRGLRVGDWKLVWDTREPVAERRWRMFDLSRDRAEQNDLSTAYPAKYAEMQRAWDRYDREVGVTP